MPSVQLDMGVTGFNWKSMIEELDQKVYQVPVRKAQAEGNSLARTLEDLKTFENKIRDLKTSLRALADNSLYQRRTAALSEGEAGGVLSVAVSSNSPIGVHAFEIQQLATATQVKSPTLALSKMLADENTPLSELNSPIPFKAGTFCLGGAQIQIDVKDTLNSVFEKIATTTEGKVRAHYNTERNTISLVADGGEALVLGTAADTSNFLSLFNLKGDGTSSIESAPLNGVLDLDLSLEESVNLDPEAQGQFFINGIKIEYTSEDSLSSIMAKVNASQAGVSIQYDSNENSFSLKNKLTGDLNIILKEGQGGLLNQLGLVGEHIQLTQGQNACFKLNGVPRESLANVLEEKDHGLKGVVVTAKKIGTEQCDIHLDTKGIKGAIDDFIKCHNELQSFVNEKTATRIVTDDKGNSKVEYESLAKKREVLDFKIELQRCISLNTSDNPEKPRLLSQLGIEFGGTGGKASRGSYLELKIKGDLEKTLSESPEKFKEFFTNADENGFNTKAQRLLDNFVVNRKADQTDLPSVVASLRASIDFQASANKTTISRFQQRAKKEKELQVNAFLKMEEVYQAMQSQEKGLQSMIRQLQPSQK